MVWCVVVCACTLWRWGVGTRFSTLSADFCRGSRRRVRPKIKKIKRCAATEGESACEVWAWEWEQDVGGGRGRGTEVFGSFGSPARNSKVFDETICWFFGSAGSEDGNSEINATNAAHQLHFFGLHNREHESKTRHNLKSNFSVPCTVLRHAQSPSPGSV